VDISYTNPQQKSTAIGHFVEFYFSKDRFPARLAFHKLHEQHQAQSIV
jgi:hypothetical protein